MKKVKTRPVFDYYIFKSYKSEVIKIAVNWKEKRLVVRNEKGIKLFDNGEKC